MKKRPFLRLLWLLLLLIFLAGCASGPVEKLWLNAPGWSRARAVVNTAINDPVTMALDDDGNVYLLSILAEEGVSLPQVTALNRQAEILWQKTVNAPLTRPDKPRIVWDGSLLHLYWLSGQRLFSARMTTMGELAAGPIQVSGDEVVGGFDVRLDKDGRLTLWYAGSRRQPGLYAFAPGDVGGTAVLVDPDGIRPTLQYDADGDLHASWVQYPSGPGRSQFFYASYAGGVFKPGQATRLTEQYLSPANILYGPWLGLTEERVYYLWAIEIRAGLEAGGQGGSFVTDYLTFPIGDPAQPQSGVLVAPSFTEFEYNAAPSTAFVTGERVSLEEYPADTSLSDVFINPSSRSELIIAFKTNVPYQFRKTRGQVGLLFLTDGRPQTFQLLTFTPKPSDTPAITNDEEGNLYLTWMERDLAGFRVYFASTAPDMVNALASVTREDVNRISGEVLFGLLSGAVLSPFLVFLWLLLPLAVLALTTFLRREDRGIFTHIGTFISLGASIVVYWLVKLLTLPGMRSYIPFSAWIPILPDWLQAPLQFGVPVLVTIAGIIVGWYFTYRRHTRSPLYFIFIFAAVDGVLTLAVYGFLVYNIL